MLATFLVVYSILIITYSIDVPIIGVIPQPCYYYGTDQCKDLNPKALSYLPASYVEWVAMSGAKTLPLFYTTNSTQLSKILSQINGVLIAGGGASTNPKSDYEQFIQLLMSEARKFHNDPSNDNQSVPIWGTCDGFENMLTAVAAKGESVLTPFNATGINLDIEWIENAINNSIMFDLKDTTNKYYGETKLMIDLMQNEPVTFNDHNHGINPTVFQQDPYIISNFTALGISYDRQNLSFIALMESKKELGLNWYASQFHPEKPLFEFESNDTIHSYDATITNAWFSQFFVDKCRTQNNNTMNESVYDVLAMYNFQPIYTGNYFEQIYTFTQ